MVLIGYLILAVIVAAVLFYAVVAVLPDGLSFGPQADRRPFALPADRRLDGSDLARIRIPAAVRGYKFAETDELIDRLAAEIAARDEEIAGLRQSQQNESSDQDVSSGQEVSLDRQEVSLDQDVSSDQEVSWDRQDGSLEKSDSAADRTESEVADRPTSERPRPAIVLPDERDV